MSSIEISAVNLGLIEWESIGIPSVYHLLRVDKEASNIPLCGGNDIALVCRRDGLYCRYCISLEGVTKT